MNKKIGSIKNYNSIDLFKFIMAAFVIAIHTKPEYYINSSAVKNVFDAFFTCAVPFFFMASGYLLAVKFTQESTAEQKNAVLVRYLKKTVKLYLFWTVIYIPPAVQHYVSDNYSPVKAVVSFFRSLIFIGQHHNSWMLWYLLSTIYAVIFIIILTKKNVSVYKITAAGAVFALAGILFDVLDANAAQLSGLPELIYKAFSLTFSAGRIFNGMFYIPLGMVLFSKKIPVPVNALVFIALGTLRCFVNNAALQSVLLMIYSATLFGLIERINLKDSKVYPILRGMSTYMYFIHMYVWLAVSYMIYRHEHYGLLPFTLTLIICIVISFIWVRIRPKILSKFNKE